MRKVLLTPGPLTTAAETRAAMSRDWGSREDDFIALTGRIRSRLAALVEAQETHEAVLLQGAGSFAVEAAIGTLVPRSGKLLVLINGAYGRRAAEMAARMGRTVVARTVSEAQPVDVAGLDDALAFDASITDVFLVHLETTSGLINPLTAVARVVARHRRRLLVDAMSSFGAVPIDLRATPCAGLIASSNKGLEGVPGVAFVLAERSHLAEMDGNSPSVSLDLHAQWRGFESLGQWRFTPPTHVVAALDAALDRLTREGGVEVRGARYRRNCEMLTAGLTRLGFSLYLLPALQGPVIVTARDPGQPWFRFSEFHRALNESGVVIYPGKLTEAASFRIGCIGAIRQTDIERCLEGIADFVAARRGARLGTWAEAGQAGSS